MATLGVLTVSVKAGCPIGGVRGRRRKIHFDLRSASRLRSLAESARETSCFGGSKVDFSWEVQAIGVVLHRCADFVANAILWT